MEKSIKINLVPKATKTNTPVIPVLGKVQELKPGVYGVLKKAQPNKSYVVICPKCGKFMTVKGQQKNCWKESCKACHTSVFFVGYPAETVNPVEKKEVKKINVPVKEESPKVKEEAAVPEKKSEGRVPTHKVKMKGQRSSGKLVWGGFFRKKNYVLKEGVNTIGRTDTSCPSDVMIDDEFASRRSVKIEVEEGTKGYLFKLTVISATNPVLYNGKSLEPEHSIFLNYGDIITLGNTKITFKPVSS